MECNSLSSRKESGGSEVPKLRLHFRCVLNYRVTGNLYITVIIFPRINFGITLQSLYRKYFWAEIILLYITLS